MGLVGRAALALVYAWTLIFAGPAFAQPPAMTVSISEGSLPEGLQTLQRQTGIEVLYDRALVSGRQSPVLKGSLTPEAALRQLLAETDLTVRRAQSGAWIVEPPAARPLARPDAVIPEILVIGRRTQNADIRRFENDVQPYTVATQAQILGAQRDNIDQFFNSRITANTQVVPADRSQTADTLSQINLRGLGADGTLVLIDGRRMPSIPAPSNEFRQPDVNPIPLHAIKRIEVLTGAAGGIYGFGALGGVVNVVLDRDTRGVELHVTQGITSRGDGRRHGVEANFGRTFRSGATDFTLFASHSESDAVLVGERNYAVRDRQRTFELAPRYYQHPHYPYGNSVSVRSAPSFDPVTLTIVPNPNLVFKPEFGGATLSSDNTFLPIGFSGSAEALVASLTQHAGQPDLSVPRREANTDLGANPQSDALLANIQHRFRAGLEAYFDAAVLRSRGEFHGSSQHERLADGEALLSPESPASPFTDYVFVRFPVEQLDPQMSDSVESTRYTAGLAANLPFDWRGTAEISSGGFRRDFSHSVDLNSPSNLYLEGDPSDLDTNPLGDWSAFQSAISGNRLHRTFSYGLDTRFRDQSLRFAGPVFTRAARPATLTLLAEHRTESVPTYSELTTIESATTSESETSVEDSHSSATTAVYAELRARPFAQDAQVPLLRELELQLAIRRDDEDNEFPSNLPNADSDRLHAEFTGTAYTAGVKMFPTSWLMLRGSYATGLQPPSLNALVELTPFTTTGPANATDPKRGGRRAGADGAYLFKLGGKQDLSEVRASTASLGAVVTPTGENGPRIAIDFSRIRRTRDVVTGLLAADVMANEDSWPERVERAPITDADRANGYTAGRVTMIDTRNMNGGELEVDAVDLHLDWPLTLLGGGRLQLYADATYHRRNVQKVPLKPDLHWAGYRNGPLKRRANGGFDWSKDRLSIGANLQYYGSSLVIQDGSLPVIDAQAVELQGSERIPSQSYLDVHGSWRFPVRPANDLTVNFGIINVLDKSPPRESILVTLGPGYNRYGDPRQRRFELGLSFRFF